MLLKPQALLQGVVREMSPRELKERDVVYRREAKKSLLCSDLTGRFDYSD